MVMRCYTKQQAYHSDVQSQDGTTNAKMVTNSGNNKHRGHRNAQCKNIEDRLSYQDDCHEG